MYDVSMSKNAITDTANWYYSDKNGKLMLAIYSTEDHSNTTFLYASKGEQAEYEAAYTRAIAKEFRNGTDRFGETPSSLAETYRGWRGPGGKYAVGTAHPGNAAGNDGLDGGAPRGEPGRTLINVLQNLSQSRDGGRGTNGAGSSLKGFNADNAPESLQSKDDSTDCLDTAMRMLDNNATPNEVFNRTGIVAFGNGNPKDGIGSPVIGRYERGGNDKRRVLQDSQSREDSRQHPGRSVEGYPERTRAVEEVGENQHE